MYMKENFTPIKLEELPGRGSFVFVDELDEHGDKKCHADNGTLARDPAFQGDILIAAEPGSRLSGHPVQDIRKVSRSTEDQTRFLLETVTGRKFILKVR